MFAAAPVRTAARCILEDLGPAAVGSGIVSQDCYHAALAALENLGKPPLPLGAAQPWMESALCGEMQAAPANQRAEGAPIWG